MRALDKKLFRDIRRLWAQSLAIALVLASGVMVMVMSFGAQRSLSETRDTYYERARFADVWSDASRAPMSLVPEIAAIEGVSRVEARISEFAILDIAGLDSPAMGQIISIPPTGEPQMNRLILRAGRLPEAGRQDEVVVNEAFATAHGFAPGDSFGVTLNGQKREVTITGIVLSPEFIYTIGPGSLMPDDKRFGILWMSEDVLAAAFNLSGAFNSVTLGITRGTDVEQVKDALETLLKPYGGTGPYGRKDQTSNAFLDGELQQWDMMVRVLPPIFLVITTFLVNMVLSRLVTLEREQIGLLKALGYGVPPVTAALMGVITGCVGGIVRDVLAGQPSILLRPELYVTASALAAGLVVAGRFVGMPDALVWSVAASAGFALRGAAIHWEIALPTYRSGGG